MPYIRPGNYPGVNIPRPDTGFGGIRYYATPNSPPTIVPVTPSRPGGYTNLGTYRGTGARDFYETLDNAAERTRLENERFNRYDHGLTQERVIPAAPRPVTPPITPNVDSLQPPRGNERQPRRQDQPRVIEPNPEANFAPSPGFAPGGGFGSQMSLQAIGPRGELDLPKPGFGTALGLLLRRGLGAALGVVLDPTELAGEPAERQEPSVTPPPLQPETPVEVPPLTELERYVEAAPNITGPAEAPLWYPPNLPEVPEAPLIEWLYELLPPSVHEPFRTGRLQIPELVISPTYPVVPNELLAFVEALPWIYPRPFKDGIVFPFTPEVFREPGYLEPRPRILPPDTRVQPFVPGQQLPGIRIVITPIGIEVRPAPSAREHPVTPPRTRTSGGRTRVGVRTRTNRRGPRRRRDRKTQGGMMYGATYRFMNRAFSSITSVMDFVQAILDNTYLDGRKLRWSWSGKVRGSQMHDTTVNPIQAFQLIINGRATVDIPGVFRDMLMMQAEDYVIGKLSQGASGLNDLMGRPYGVGIQVGQVL